MKNNKIYTNIIALIITIVLMLSVCVPVSAQVTSNDSLSNDYKIDDNLESIINNAADDDIIPVAMWLADISKEDRSDMISTEIRNAEIRGDLTSHIISCTDLDEINNGDLTEEDLSNQAQTLVEIKRGVEKKLHSQNNSRVLSNLSLETADDSGVLFISNYSPLLIANMTKEDIANSINNSLVEEIYYYDIESLREENMSFNDNSVVLCEETETEVVTTSQSSYPYGVWQNITNINVLRDALGYTGEGVKVGVLGISTADFDYEGISETDREKLYEQFAYHIENNLLHFSEYDFTNNNGDHSNYVLSILSGYAEDYEGVAPLAEIYCDGFYDDPDNLFTPTEKMIDNGVNVIAGSFSWGYYNNGYDYIAKYFDYVVSNSDITICISSGNINQTNTQVTELSSSAMPYNIITVGNIDDNQTITKTDDEIYATSRYNNDSNGVYKPDICAPGRYVSTYVENNMTNGGTSASCPVVAGICALLMEAVPELKTDPMLLKSILMASAYELDTTVDIYSTASSIEPALTRECGAGMIDAYVAYQCCANSDYESYSSFYNTSYNYPIDVSQNDITANKDIYLALNWMQWNTGSDDWDFDENYNILNGYHHTLSLYDSDGILVAVSDYQYDRKQFIRYKPLQAGRYTAKITRTNTGTLQYYPQFAVAHCKK